MTMDTQELRLDGNAIAGMLDEVLRVEATTVIARCGSCGAEAALGAAHAYVQCPGAVLRCSGCGEVLMRFAHIRGHLVADMHGVGRLTF
jgi:predicted RNA-binding Zn-ribbon protein involved in translation (DUF1610 family)